MTKFIVVRHCEAEQNRNMIFQGKLDGQVSALGEEQLTYLAERFKDVHIDKIYSSSRVRAYKTAQAVNKYHGLDIVIDDRLAEIYGGDWEGKCLLDFPELFPEHLSVWNNEPHLFVAPNGESMRSVYDRVSSLVCELIVKFPNETIVLSSHGCAVRNLLCWFKYDDLKCIKKLPWPANTAVYEFEYDGKNKSIIRENDISHLPQNMQTLSSQKWSE